MSKLQKGENTIFLHFGPQTYFPKLKWIIFKAFLIFLLFFSVLVLEEDILLFQLLMMWDVIFTVL